MAIVPATEPSAAPRAAIYRRVSRKLQADNYSLGAQDKDGRAYADKIGANVVKVFEDIDSGADWNLPGMDEMLDWASRDAFDVLICPDPDRLARGLGKQLTVEAELREYGKEIAFLSLPKTGDDDADEFMRLVYGGIAEMERKKIRRRTQRGLREKVARGLVVGAGVCPFGYQYVTETRTGVSTKPRVIGLATNASTAPVVQRIVSHLRTQSIQAVCAALNAEGVPSPRDGQWTAGTLVDIVRNPVYIGRYYFGRTRQPKESGKRHKYRLDVSDQPYATVPALVSEADMAATHQALDRRKQHHGRRKASDGPDPYLLRGLLACSHCGGPLACMPNGTSRYYQCLRTKPGRAKLQNAEVCKLPPVPAVGLEDLAWETVIHSLLDPDYLRAALEDARTASILARRQAERLAIIENASATRETRLVSLTISHADAEAGSPTKSALAGAIKQTEQEILTLREEAETLRGLPTPGLSAVHADEIEALAASIRDDANDTTPSSRRRIYELLQLRVVVRRDMTHGIKLARDNRFTFKWEAMIRLRNGERLPNAIRLSFRSPAGDGLRLELVA